MATHLTKILKLSKSASFMQTPQLLRTPMRTAVYSETGSVLSKPVKVKFGMLRVLLTVVPFLYFGATAAKEGAEFLEENDIFVPEEDEDD